jgi:hypothetical protein
LWNGCADAPSSLTGTHRNRGIAFWSDWQLQHIDGGDLAAMSRSAILGD